ncbi:hypothetical protein Desor_2462 [Desulfosporosinus orientis DSM 765]|uniref:Uncharacterized protein n=1 Tax=Desulfosporosinus orientis (strain ATCC 19365 / DSM 765 / NCIMB 8382 / VKM B-1628 / Singapore I) TaxID=768706 RepID=G7WFE3_DESOD|nr:DUF6179 domain-containing protein [Desulfosporosinus orientis]AET68029.1 hypothetical protein Desor_2462 [Desulfosporosinus orientis DSM 765]
MADIDKIRRIKRETLSSEYYFKSLLEQAYVWGMLSDTQLEKIQFDCLSLLAKQTERYNSGGSTSIPVEGAQSLLTSIMFTISVGLKTYPNPDEAVAALQKDGISPLYQKGREGIDGLIKSTKILHSSIISHLLQTENVFYHSTIVDGIKGFFKLYYPEFAAQEIHITADYPVHHRLERLAGIEFIQKYLECIYYENLFCLQFSAEDIHHLLCGCDEHYEQLLVNIYEPVLAAAMGCILSGRDIRRLEMVPSSLQILNDLFRGKRRPQIEGILRESVGQLSGLLELSEPLERYLRGSLPQIAGAIENAVRLQTLDRVFILPKYPENNPKLVFSFGEKMEDENYRKVLEEIRQCRYLTDKKALIKREIHSLADLEDVLLDAELSEKEILSIFRELNPAEIAALLKKHPMPSALDQYELRVREIGLGQCLQKFLAELPAKERDLIKQAAAILDSLEI